ncbi:MAG: hypothetical protein AAGA21_03670 [Pseudomonadota bacterium]
MSDETGVVALDSATQLRDVHRGQVVVCGSHGGVYCGYLAATAGLRAVILNDAGGGLDQAGLGCLDYCEQLGMAAATCAHDSARIGDGQDMAKRGVVNRVNKIAAACGCAPGMNVAEAAERLRAASFQAWRIRPFREARHVVASDGEPRIVCVDSASLITEDDVGQIILTGSHGGLLGGRAEAALKVNAFAAFFNDAGLGKDKAGIGRLAVLDRSGIVGATVEAMSARIGDGLSTYADGRLSFLNERAASCGLRVGIYAKEAVEQLQSGER